MGGLLERLSPVPFAFQKDRPQSYRHRPPLEFHCFWPIDGTARQANNLHLAYGILVRPLYRSSGLHSNAQQVYSCQIHRLVGDRVAVELIAVLKCNRRVMCPL